MIFMKRNWFLFFFVFIFIIFQSFLLNSIAYWQEWETWNNWDWIINQEDKEKKDNKNESKNHEWDIFSELDWKQNSVILKPKFQFWVTNNKWKVLKWSVEVFFFDWKRTKLWSCKLNWWLCELDLKNKNLEWTSWFIWILIDWTAINEFLPFDFSKERNSQLEYWSSNVIHWFANIHINLIPSSDHSWYSFHSYNVISWSDSNIWQEDWENLDWWTFNSELIKWTFDPKLWLWKISIINFEWIEISDPFFVKADNRWNFSNHFELSVKKSNFEIWKNYSIVFYPQEKWTVRSWKTIMYSWYSEMKKEFDWIHLNYNKKYSTIVDPWIPFFKLLFIWAFCWIIVFIMNRYFISWMNYLRWDKTQIWKIVDKKRLF